MKSQKQMDYERVASAITYIQNHYKNQPDLEEVAAAVHMSPAHFQRMFQEWAGVSPKKFVQYLTIGYAKKVLKETQSTLFDAALKSGLSGTGRLHDLFVQIEGMTPGEYKNGGAALKIQYSFADTPFGKVLVASTSKGVCYLAFTEADENDALDHLKRMFPNAQFSQKEDLKQQEALSVFYHDWNNLRQIKLHLKGSAFQLKIWETLLKVPEGALITYSHLAEKAQHLGAQRAVGTAIGKNPVAFLIPCHRIIRSTGELGNYRWGEVRKNIIVGWEASKYGKNDDCTFKGMACRNDVQDY